MIQVIEAKVDNHVKQKDRQRERASLNVTKYGSLPWPWFDLAWLKQILLNRKDCNECYSVLKQMEP
jgi:hypothetical protein